MRESLATLHHSHHHCVHLVRAVFRHFVESLLNIFDIVLLSLRQRERERESVNMDAHTYTLTFTYLYGVDFNAIQFVRKVRVEYEVVAVFDILALRVLC